MKHIDMQINRSNCFKLLAACFYEPDRDLFLQEKLCDNLVSLFSACGYASAAEAARTMLIALSELSDEKMKIEYARLFVGPFELIAPPYGSVYLEDKRRLMGESTMAVQKMYKEMGLSLDVKEAPDHIALELEFMHYLFIGEMDAESRGQTNEANGFARMQSKFMVNFLGPWMPAFCEKIRQGTENRFYANLADCLEGFTREMTSQYQTASSMKKAGEKHDCSASA